MGNTLSWMAWGGEQPEGSGRTGESTEGRGRRRPGLRNATNEVIESEVAAEVHAPDPKEVELIQVKSVDLHIKENTKAHHTNEFDITDSLIFDNRELLVLRRGQKFNTTINFNRAYDATKDDLRIVFQFGKRPLPTKGTHVEFVLSAKDVTNDWGAYITGTDANSLKLTIMTPADIAVGQWKLKIDVVKRADNTVKVFRYEHKEPLYILFNPWCKADQVYLHETNLLEEYILNESGKIYSGSSKRISPKPWVFGQFTGDVLDCVLYLLDKSRLPDHSRGDPVIVSRKISSLVNAPDDSGILVGNWSGDYEGGTSPLEWTGSVAIIEEYFKNKSPVQYGQCWVFSGVVTTVCRALGIPARSVTNFASAHDTDGSVTIDMHFNDKGESLDEYNDDSVWNFHVWNDVWMARPDLPSGYGGWQAIDATPQETSDDIYCMGPMSLMAIKRGEVNLPYDGKFVFAEVNADRVYWKMSEEGAMEKVGVRKNTVGKYISTKRAFGRATWRDMIAASMDPDREDVTNEYKFSEGSEEERAAVRRANLHSSKAGIYETTAEDVTFELSANPDTFMGDDMEVTLTVKNTSAAERTINGSLVLASMYYTGVFYKEVAKNTLRYLKLEANKETTIKLKVPVDDYLHKLMDHCICRISCMCIVQETRQAFTDLDELRLRKPHLTLKAPSKAKVGEKFKVEVTFENPLPETLSKCELRVEGPGLQRPVVYKQPNVNARSTFAGSFDMTPLKAGDKEIVVYFNCNHISSVNSSHPLIVE